MTYRFKARLFEPPFMPYYDAYKGHSFTILDEHPDPSATDHVWLKCVDDPSIIVDGYVELNDLEEIL